MKLTLINHACCKVQTSSLTFLFDPWIEGSAFNNGWDLLIRTPFTFDQIMQGVTHIWFSHEHPDHFSVPFLSQVAKTHADKVTILFQKTRDQRVLQFCTSIGLKFHELEDNIPTRLNDEITATCVAQDFYDSWLLLSDGRTSILNLNDCHTRSESELRKIASIAPSPTLLLSQFSYASWKGGKDNAEFRAQAAAQKLQTLAEQIRWIKPRYTLPFASLIYFSNEENNYLNDFVNTPAKASLVIEEAGSKPLILFPGDAWQTEANSHNNSSALARYQECYENLPNLPLRKAGDSTNLSELKTAFGKYQAKIFEKNSRLLIVLLSRFALFKAFQPVIVDLYDINALLCVSITDGLKHLPAQGAKADVRMHSSSLHFIFKNDFGFDTLCVNGRFESGPGGFAKMTKTFAVGSLNAMGLSLSAKLLFDLRFIVLLVRILNGVMSKLSQSERKVGAQKQTSTTPEPLLAAEEKSSAKELSASRK